MPTPKVTLIETVRFFIAAWREARQHEHAMKHSARYYDAVQAPLNPNTKGSR